MRLPFASFTRLASPRLASVHALFRLHVRLLLHACLLFKFRALSFLFLLSSRLPARLFSFVRSPFSFATGALVILLLRPLISKRSACRALSRLSNSSFVLQLYMYMYSYMYSYMLPSFVPFCICKSDCPNRGSNTGPYDLQSYALPTELSELVLLVLCRFQSQPYGASFQLAYTSTEQLQLQSETKAARTNVMQRRVRSSCCKSCI